MHSTKIIVNGIEGNRMAQVVDFLGKSVCQAGEAAHLHSHREILPFRIAGRNMSWVRPSGDRGRHSSNESRRTVTNFFLRGSVNLDQRGVVNIATKRAFDGFQVDSQAIGRHLNAIRKATRQVQHEMMRTPRVAGADKIGDQQLRVGIYGGPRPSVTVTKLAAQMLRHVPLLRVAELPDFIALDAARSYVAHCAVMEIGTRLADIFQKRENRSFRDSGHATRSANGIAFHESRYHGDLLGERESVHVHHYA